jgi:hypothetical protein
VRNFIATTIGNTMRIIEDMDAARETTADAAIIRAVKRYSEVAALGKDDIQFAGASLRFGVTWMQHAFPRVVVGHKNAASMCCTNYSGELPALPWPSFAIGIPAGLIDDDPECGIFIRHCGGCTFDIIRTHGRYESWKLGTTIEDFVESPVPVASDIWTPHDNGLPIPLDAGEKDRRTRQLIARIFAGVVIEMAEVIESRPSVATPTIKKRRGIPKAWTFTLSRPIKNDMRSAVREYVTGKRHGKLSLQHMVRGHYKHQPFGTNERRLIHIEPYWRGPEDAPIQTRSYIQDRT